MVGAAAGYFFVRAITEGSVDAAFDHADDVVAVEKALGIFWEIEAQEFIVDHRWLVNLVNWIYIWGHWPVIVLSALWLLLRKPQTFYLYRNAFLISGAIGMVIFATFPLAPPRLVPGLDILDTVTEHSHSYRVLQPPSITNQYAAMPSLHFGWNLLIGIALARNVGFLGVRIFGAVSPIFMAFAVVLTANHFIIDVPAGAAVALFGLYAAWQLRRWRSDPPGWASRVPYVRARVASRAGRPAKRSEKHAAPGA